MYGRLSMKKFILAALLLHMTIYSVSAQDADAILGIWHSPHGHTDIQIIKKDNLYSGVTTSLKDTHPGHLPSGPDTGVVILKDFKYRRKGIYNGGKVLDSKSGRSYNGQMKLINNDRLDIRIFFGIIQFGRTETWTRVKE